MEGMKLRFGQTLAIMYMYIFYIFYIYIYIYFSPGIYTELKDSFGNLSLVGRELSVSFYDFSDTSSLTWLISAN